MGDKIDTSAWHLLDKNENPFYDYSATTKRRLNKWISMQNI